MAEMSAVSGSAELSAVGVEDFLSAEAVRCWLPPLDPLYPFMSGVPPNRLVSAADFVLE